VSPWVCELWKNSFSNLASKAQLPDEGKLRAYAGQRRVASLDCPLGDATETLFAARSSHDIILVATGCLKID
jgi:hypothetical protein